MEPGQSLGSNEALVVMADELIIRAQVDETDLAQIKTGQPADVVLEAYPRRVIEGVVEHVSYESEVVSNVTVYNVDIRPMDGVDLMRSGMNAMVEAEIAKSTNALLVPASAIEHAGKDSYIHVRIPSGEVQRKKVQTGISDGSNTEITKGISEGDTVVLFLDSRPGSGSRFRRTGLPGMGGN